jgi:hypothetical protein
MTDEQTLLRNAIRAEAESVPMRPDLADAIVRAAASVPTGRVSETAVTRTGWRNWVLPIAAAAIVAVAAGAVVVGAKSLRHSDTAIRPSPGLSSAPTSVPNSSAPTKTSPSQSSPSESQSSMATAPAVPVGFRVIDLTWVSEDEGWALSYPICKDGTCIAVAHTIDGGRSWTAVRTPDFSMLDTAACDPTCINHLRFANSQVGYAFSGRAMFMTTDGGVSWRQDTTPTYALEVSHGIALRLVGQVADCAPSCRFRLQRADVGSTKWQDVPLPGAPSSAVSATLARSGSTVAIGMYQHTAGGAQNAQSTVLTSNDDGRTWTNRGEPCPQNGSSAAGAEVDSQFVTTSPDGAIVMLCTPRGAGTGQFTVVSTDGGQHFTSGGRLTQGLQEDLVAASAKVLFLGNAPLRSTDGGKSWTQAPPRAGVKVIVQGFETPTIGRALTVTGYIGSPTIWTTRDAGLTWTSYTFK